MEQVAVKFDEVGEQLIYFNVGFARVIAADYSGNRQLQAGRLAKSLTIPENALLIFGDDWNSAIPYEAERKAITLLYWAAAATFRRILALRAVLGEAGGCQILAPGRQRQ